MVLALVMKPQEVLDCTYAGIIITCHSLHLCLLVFYDILAFSASIFPMSEEYKRSHISSRASQLSSREAWRLDVSVSSLRTQRKIC